MKLRDYVLKIILSQEQKEKLIRAEDPEIDSAYLKLSISNQYLFLKNH